LEAPPMLVGDRLWAVSNSKVEGFELISGQLVPYDVESPTRWAGPLASNGGETIVGRAMLSASSNSISSLRRERLGPSQAGYVVAASTGLPSHLPPPRTHAKIGGQ